MIRGPSVDEFVVARGPRQQHPAGAAALCLAHGCKLRCPLRHTAKILLKLGQQAGTGRACAKAVEIQFVQDHGIARDEFFAFQAIHHEYGRGCPVKFGKLLFDGIEPFYRAAIIVFVMTDDDLFGQAGQRTGIAGEGFHFVRHVLSNQVGVDQTDRRTGADHF